MNKTRNNTPAKKKNNVPWYALVNVDWYGLVSAGHEPVSRCEGMLWRRVVNSTAQNGPQTGAGILALDISISPGCNCRMCVCVCGGKRNGTAVGSGCRLLLYLLFLIPSLRMRFCSFKRDGLRRKAMLLYALWVGKLVSALVLLLFYNGKQKDV